MNPDIRVDRRRFAAIAAGAGALIGSGLRTGIDVAAQDDEMNQPDGTSLFGSGEDRMPSVPVRWRIVSQTAKPERDAPELARTLNFLTPTSDVPVIVDNLTTGVTTSIPTHVAASAFGAEGDVQKRFVEQDEPAPYVAFELIVADHDNPDTIGSGTWLGSTDPFTAPKGSQEMEMAALVINASSDPARAVPDFGDDYPLIGYAHLQPLNVIHANDQVTPLKAGETIVLAAGDVIEFAGSDDANGSLYFARFVTQRSY